MIDFIAFVFGLCAIAILSLILLFLIFVVIFAIAIFISVVAEKENWAVRIWRDFL